MLAAPSGSSNPDSWVVLVCSESAPVQLQERRAGGAGGAGHNALLALLCHEPLQSCPWRTEREARAERTQEEEQKTEAAGGWAGISGGRGAGTQKGRCAERLPAPSFHTGKNLGA